VVVVVLGAGAVGADIVGAPAAPELLATGGELDDQVVEALVVRVCPAAVRRLATVMSAPRSQSGVEPVGGAVEEGEPGEVRCAVGVVVEVGV
jgi:hypothetical protein